MLKKCFLSIVLFSFYSLAHANIPIAFCEDLNKISSNMSGYYYLTQNINCGTFHPIDGVFTGTLDGQGFSISNLSIVNQDGRRSENTGIFRATGNGTQIFDITFINTKVLAHTDAHRGVIAGVAEGNVSISNVTFYGLEIMRYDLVDHKKKKDLGGTGSIVGLATNGTIIINRVKLIGKAETVLIGQNAFAGGLVGIAEGSIVVENSAIWRLESKGSKDCYNPANECGYGGLIGLIGKFEPHNHNNPPDTHVPGLPDGYSAIISQSSVQGNLFSDKNIGGMVGMIKSNRAVLIENSFTDVHIKCRDYTWRGDCSLPSKYAGGLIGKAVEASDQKMIALANVYVAGAIDVNNDPYTGWETYSAAIVGFDESPSSRIINLPNTHSFFDSDVTKKNSSGDKVSVGMTTEQMQSGKSLLFATWSPLLWSFNLGYYPILINSPPEQY